MQRQRCTLMQPAVIGLDEMNWRAIFEPSLAIGELVVRGSLIYLSLFFIIRLIARRQTGSLGTADLLVIVVIADAAQNGFGKEYTSVTEAVVLVLTIVAWDYLIDWLAWKSPVLRRWLIAPPLTVVIDGRYNEPNMRREMISRDELDAQIRLAGIDDIAEIKIARLEGDGRLSVIKKMGSAGQSTNAP